MPKTETPEPDVPVPSPPPDPEPDDSQPAWEGSLSSSVPLISPDGHVHLSQEEIDARDK